MSKASDKELKNLFKQGDDAVKNLYQIKKDMVRKGIIGFCKVCGGNIYKDKKHKCI